MNKIADIELYNDQMSHSIEDKLFFLDTLKANDFDTIVDFGCANGELLKQVHRPCLKFGVDNNEEMLKAAKLNCESGHFVKSLDDLKDLDKSEAVLNMSSVLHEVYSYLPREDVNHFWDTVFNSGYKYIVIRDMMVSSHTNRDMELEDLKVITKNPEYKVLFQDFHKVFPEWRIRDLLHFLMKYRYVENWKRERDENYFPITVEELMGIIPKDKYKIVHWEPYTLKWVKFRVFKDFKYEIKDNTHIKVILERTK